jgi:hypothetical protein
VAYGTESKLGEVYWELVGAQLKKQEIKNDFKYDLKDFTVTLDDFIASF